MAEDKNYTNAPLEEDELEIDLMEYARKLWEARKMLLKLAGIAIFIGLIVAWSIPTKYKVEVTLSPESGKSGGGGSALSGMAAMLGIGNFSMGSEANAVNFTMAPEIVASTPFLLELYHTRVQTIDGKMDTTIVAYLETHKRPWWSYIPALPSMAIGGVMSLFADDAEKKDEKIDPFRLTPKQMGEIGSIKNIIKVNLDKKTQMTKVSVIAQDPLVAATMADTVITKLQKYITTYQAAKAQEDCYYLEQIYKERQEEYYKAQERYAQYMDSNQNLAWQRKEAESERLENEMQLAYEVYSSVASQLPMARAKVQEAKPSFMVLEPASVPLSPANIPTRYIIVGVVFFVLMGASAWVLFGKDLWESLKEGLKEPKEEK